MQPHQQRVVEEEAGIVRQAKQTGAHSWERRCMPVFQRMSSRA